MDYFNYNKTSTTNRSTDSSPEGILPSTPTIFIHDAGKSPSRPTCIRYSASFFSPEEIEQAATSTTTTAKTITNRNKQQVFDMNTLSSSLPSPPTTTNSTTTSNKMTTCSPSLSLPLPNNNNNNNNTATTIITTIHKNKRRFSTPPHTLNSPRLHILLVDDNSINLQVLSRLLNHHMSDYIEHLELVKSGVKALEVLKCRPFDLILMDIDMPILNGIETTKHIRSCQEFDILLQNRAVPIVAVTTNDSIEWRQTYTNIGMNGCISKPISPTELKSTLAKVLGLHLPIPPYTPE